MNVRTNTDWLFYIESRVRVPVVLYTTWLCVCQGATYREWTCVSATVPPHGRGLRQDLDLETFRVCPTHLSPTLIAILQMLALLALLVLLNGCSINAQKLQFNPVSYYSTVELHSVCSHKIKICNMPSFSNDCTRWLGTYDVTPQLWASFLRSHALSLLSTVPTLGMSLSAPNLTVIW
jgi:hypothetical protein